MLIDRPYAGVMRLTNNRLRQFTHSIACSDRYGIVKLGNYLFVNVYLPCVGSADRKLLCEPILTEIWALRQQYNECNIIIADDL